MNVALVAFPQCMAYAIIAGLPISYGIFCYLAAAILGSLFSDSRYSSLGPTNATAMLMLGAFMTSGIEGERLLQGVSVLVLMTGIFLIIGAFANIARLIQFISRTVIVGYITAAALQIIINQIKNVLGYSVPQSPSLLGVTLSTIENIGNTHWPSLALGVLTYISYSIFKKYFPAFPNVAAVLFLMSCTAYIMGLAGFEIKTLAPVPAGIWKLAAPSTDFDLINQLASPALALAFLVMLEANSIGKSLASRSGQQFHANQEMFGLGISNVVAGLTGGMVASASLTRSLLNFQSGAVSSLTNVFAGILVALLFIGLSPLIPFIPLPALAVVVITIGVSLISRHQIRVVSKSTRSDAIVFYVTLIAGLLLALDTAIYLGSAVSIILFLKKVAKPELIEFNFDEEGHLTELESQSERANPEISIVHVEGELFFGAADLFYNQIRRIAEAPELKVLVLKLRNAHRLDASAVIALDDLVTQIKEQNRHLLVAEVRKDVLRLFKNSNLVEKIGRENVFPDNSQNPTLSTAKALKRARTLLGGEDASISIYVDNKRVGGDA